MTLASALSAALGGALIGLAAVLLLWLAGRIAGVSGIFGGLWSAPAGDRGWRWFFVAGLIAGGAASAWLTAPAPPRAGFAPWLLVVAGLLVGYGTTLGSGCTSGHGVCGLARGSPRSLVAVGVFVGTAMLTTTLVRVLA